MPLHTVTFDGIPGGDNECFCWHVSVTDYQKATDQMPDKHDRSRDGTYMLHPDHLIPEALKEHGRKLRFTLTIDVAPEPDKAA